MSKLFRCVSGLLVMAALGCETPSPQNEGGAGADSTGTGVPDCPVDPAEGHVAPGCGIWVSASMGYDNNSGTQVSPVRTLGRAIELAEEGPGRVYACLETWYETLLVPGSVSLHGGFDCKQGWQYVASLENRSKLTPVSTFGITWVESDTTNLPIMTDFHVEAITATAPGGSSIGVFVRDQVGLEVRRCTIVAGDGADGLNGEDGGPGEPVAQGGVDGTNGGDACSALVSEGGIGPMSSCDDFDSTGGDGGDGGLMVATSGGDGSPPGPEPNHGKGGVGEGVAPSCAMGYWGDPGEIGVSGAGAKQLDGYLTKEGYTGGYGGDGGPGGHGRGGGGGGATFGSVAVCGSAKPGGAGGGSGGTGGCGGLGGKGGQGGGSSLGVALNAGSDMLFYTSIVDSRIVVGNSGRGGNGGKPQSGGPGGLAGKGGAGAGSINPGCNGGHGGVGGPGGWGGGGLGGFVYCIATRWSGMDQYFPISNNIDCELGKPGGGGHGDPLVAVGGAQNGFTGERGVILGK